MFQVASQMSREETGLNTGYQTHGDPAIQQPVTDLFCLALLVSGHHFPASVIGKEHSTPGPFNEMLISHLPAIDERKRQPVSECRPQLFYEIQGERCSARTYTVQEADLRIQATSSRAATQFVNTSA